MRTVGILGGMGPEATIDLMSRVLARVDAKDDADHVPLIVDQNTKIPSRIKYLLEGSGDDPGPVIREMAQRLARAGAEALAMPCNTAHHWRAEIEAAGLPLLDMVKLTEGVALAGSHRVGILASPATQHIGLFDESLMWPEDTAALLSIIRSVKKEGVTEDSGAALAIQAEALAARGVDGIILGCSEFSVLAPYLCKPTLQNICITDGLDVLAGAIVRFAKGGKE